MTNTLESHRYWHVINIIIYFTLDNDPYYIVAYLKLDAEVSLLLYTEFIRSKVQNKKGKDRKSNNSTYQKRC